MTCDLHKETCQDIKLASGELSRDADRTEIAEMADGDGSFLTVFVIGVSLKCH